MIAWRLARRPFKALDGAGGRHDDGRWHTLGHEVIYASTHLSLTLLEKLVNLEVDTEDLPDGLLALEVELPDDSIEHVAAASPDRAKSQALGDEWLEATRTLLLSVPSVIVPQERNVLINPNHPRMRDVVMRSEAPFEIDHRLMR